MRIGVGFLELFSTPVGNYKLCGSCNVKLKRTGFLLTDDAKLFLDGTVEHIIEPEEEVNGHLICPNCNEFCHRLKNRHWFCDHCQREFRGFIEVNS